MGFVNAHFIAYTGDLGVTAIQGAYALATVGIAGLAGGLGFGFMADKCSCCPSYSAPSATRYC